MTDWVYGVHAVTALLNNSHRQTKRLFLNEDRHDKRLQLIKEQAHLKAIPLEFLSIQKMNQRFADAIHQGVVAEVQALPDYNEYDLAALVEKSKSPPLILILDGITDPQNLGACLRTADAVGVDFVVIPKDKSASISPVVSKVACGAADTIPFVRVTNLVRAIETIKEKGIWVYGAAGEAKQSVYAFDFKSPIALVLGAEGSGLRRLTREHCDDLFSLPMRGTVESLNVSVATGVALYEVLRQRLSI